MAQHLVRYGDGEEYILRGTGPERNCDGHPLHIPEMQRDLLLTVEEPKAGITYGATPDAMPYLKETYPDIQWVHGDMFKDMYMDGTCEKWIDQWKDTKKVLVGPTHLRRLPFWNKDFLHIRVRDGECYFDKPVVMYQLRKVAGIAGVVFFSACALSEILIYNLHELFCEASLIDVGAFWDPFCGVKSRAFHSRTRQA